MISYNDILDGPDPLFEWTEERLQELSRKQKRQIELDRLKGQAIEEKYADALNAWRNEKGNRNE